MPLPFTPEGLIDMEALANEAVIAGLRQQGKVPQAAARPDVGQLYDQLATLQGKPVDYSALESANKGRIAQARRDAVAGLALHSMGGKRLTQPGGHIFAKALGEMEPLRANLADVGYVNPETGELVENPAQARTREEKMITGRIDALVREQQAEANRLLAEGRLEEAKRARDLADYWKGKAFENLERRTDIAENKAAAAAAKAGEPKAAHGLMSSDGRPVYRSPDGYFVHADGTPLTAPPMTTGEQSEQAQALKKEALAYSKAKDLLKAVQENPGAYSVSANTVSMLPLGPLSGAVKSRVMTDKEQQVRARVSAEAYVTIHDLAGAALSMGEAGRLDQFVPAQGDDDATLVNKLRGAIAEYEKMLTERKRLKGVTANPASTPAAAPPGAASAPMVIPPGAVRRK